VPEDEGYYCSCGRFVVDSFCDSCQGADELEACSRTPEHEQQLLCDAKNLPVRNIDDVLNDLACEMKKDLAIPKLDSCTNEELLEELL